MEYFNMSSPKILAIGSPKGGVGKSTIAVHIAYVLARLLGLRVLLVDADPIRTAYDYANLGDDELMPFDVTTATGAEAEQLAELRQIRGYDVIVVDLPGAKYEENAFEHLLRPRPGPNGRKRKAVPDGLLMPARPEMPDLAPVRKALKAGEIPPDLPYLTVFSFVESASRELAWERQAEFRELGYSVANTIIRRTTKYRDAFELGRTMFDMPGARPKPNDGDGERRWPYTRKAATEQRELAKEAAQLIGLDITREESPNHG